MLDARFIPLVFKQVIRHRTRSALTMGGVATVMFLFIAIQTIQDGVRRATERSSRDATLIVFRENRYCPATSRLPQRYEERIAGIPGVVDVIPMQIVVNNCRASLDVVTFRGVRPRDLDALAAHWECVEGSMDAWLKRSDAALVGEVLARRRGLSAGDAFDSSGVSVVVAGIIRSTQPQDQNVAYVHLEFLQRSALRAGVGEVTQFEVRVEDPSRIEEVAKAIDAEFSTDVEPTATRPEKEFVARAARDVMEMVGFTRWLALGCLAAAVALVANSVVLSVRDRVREHAVLQTLGFRSGLIARLIVGESFLLALMGGAVGAVGAFALVQFGNFSLSVEGLSIGIRPELRSILFGWLVSGAAGLIAGLAPALRASRREIAACFRAV